jgi:hypothetical protein
MHHEHGKYRFVDERSGHSAKDLLPKLTVSETANHQQIRLELDGDLLQL